MQRRSEQTKQITGFRETMLFLVSKHACIREFLNSAQTGMKPACFSHTQQLLVKMDRWRLFAEKEQVWADLGPGESASLQDKG